MPDIGKNITVALNQSPEVPDSPGESEISQVSPAETASLRDELETLLSVEKLLNLEKAIQKAEELIEISTHQLPDLEKLKGILSELNQILYLVLEIAHVGDRDEEAPESLVKDIRTDAQKEAKGSRQPGKSELQT